MHSSAAARRSSLFVAMVFSLMLTAWPGLAAGEPVSESQPIRVISAEFRRAPAATRPAPPTGTRPAPTASRPDTVQLLGSDNLDAFYTYIKGRGRDADPQRVFTVADGILRVSGEEMGCITTREEFDNYTLVAEYKWGTRTWAPRIDRARDSGILLHSVGADGCYGGMWMCSIEVQLIEGGTGDFIVVTDGTDRYVMTATARREGDQAVFDPAGGPLTITTGRINWWGRDPAWRDAIGFRGPRDLEKPLGEWNRLECRARGDSIEVHLNGVLVNRCTDVRPRRGRIQVQSEGAEILFRRLDLLPCSALPATSPR